MVVALLLLLRLHRGFLRLTCIAAMSPMRHVRWEPKFGMEMGMVRVRIYRYGLWCRVRGLEWACGGGGRMDDRYLDGIGRVLYVRVLYGILVYNRHACPRGVSSSSSSSSSYSARHPAKGIALPTLLDETEFLLPSSATRLRGCRHSGIGSSV